MSIELISDRWMLKISDKKCPLISLKDEFLWAKQLVKDLRVCDLWSEKLLFFLFTCITNCFTMYKGQQKIS